MVLYYSLSTYFISGVSKASYPFLVTGLIQLIHSVNSDNWELKSGPNVVLFVVNVTLCFNR